MSRPRELTPTSEAYKYKSATAITLLFILCCYVMSIVFDLEGKFEFQKPMLPNLLLKYYVSMYSFDALVILGQSFAILHSRPNIYYHLPT